MLKQVLDSKWKAVYLDNSLCRIGSCIGWICASVGAFSVQDCCADFLFCIQQEHSVLRYRCVHLHSGCLSLVQLPNIWVEMYLQ